MTARPATLEAALAEVLGPEVESQLRAIRRGDSQEEHTWLQFANVREDAWDRVVAHVAAVLADTMREWETGRVEACGAQYGSNPDLCHQPRGHAGTHSNRYGTTWAALHGTEAGEPAVSGGDEQAGLTADEREALATCVWGIGANTRSPLLPLLLSEVERILAARVAEARAEAVRETGERIAALAEEFGAKGSQTPLGRGTRVDVAWREASRRRLRALARALTADAEGES